MNAESPDLMHPVPTDRRPAIWPWLVMPLIALTAFYCLERLEAQEQDSLARRPMAAAPSDRDVGKGASEDDLGTSR